MSETDISGAIERVMGRVDYYLHCELDEEYEHDRPEAARRQLEAALRAELLRASAVGLVTTLTQAPTLPNIHRFFGASRHPA
ncbi:MULTISPECIES: hypothetical protein [unclassified Variovorax]|uniref:hypothetical protein n=1 Tax=unclassified Variovorax TaxID=663243 RepID=UPI001BD310FC|nr:MULTISPECIES: hypothetical protein [unclassified Variovorax]